MSKGVRIPDGFVDELKARVRPSDVIGRKVKLKKQGKEWVGLSPFTAEKTPSFYVNDQKRIFKCFSSGIGGDVISFVMETERLSFMDAVEKLAAEVGMELPKATPEAAEAYDRRKRLQAACEAAARFFEKAKKRASIWMDADCRRRPGRAIALATRRMIGARPACISKPKGSPKTRFWRPALPKSLTRAANPMTRFAGALCFLSQIAEAASSRLVGEA
jgi:DNA primase